MTDARNPQLSTSVLLNAIDRGGIVGNAELAASIAELLIETHYGEAEMARQRPFVVFDESDRWRIRGSYNAERKLEGNGPAVIVIFKSDGRVLELVVTKIDKIPQDIIDGLSDEEKRAAAVRSRKFYGD